MFRTLLALSVCLLSSTLCFTQPNYNLPISGNYQPEKGAVYIRLKYNLIERVNNTWSTSYNLKEEADAALEKLNLYFNPHQIYFIPFGGYDNCGGMGAEAYSRFTVDTQGGFLSVEDFRANSYPQPWQSEQEKVGALNIYVTNDVGAISGLEAGVPSIFCTLKGSRNGKLVSQTELIAHEVGHCLGLVHPHTGSNSGNPAFECNESNIPANWDNCDPGTLPCHCCGDYICDTPPFPDNSPILIPVTPGCEIDANINDPSDILLNLSSNIMSYVEDLATGSCRVKFTEEQGRRMRTYLNRLEEEHNVSFLNDIQQLPIQENMVVLPEIAGNIIVGPGEELIIDQPLTMLPGATIRVKNSDNPNIPGGRLLIKAEITAICGLMWRGIIVEGHHTNTAEQKGKVRLESVNALVRHATIGINSIEVGSDCISDCPAGGIVEVQGGRLVDNEVGIQIGSQPVKSEDLLFFPTIRVTDNYLSSNPPIGLNLFSTNRLRVQHATIEDSRSAVCITEPDKMMTGIKAKNASLIIYGGSFKNLLDGVTFQNFSINSALSIKSSYFERCLTGVQAISTLGTSVKESSFLVNLPQSCSGSSNNFDAIGIELEGNSMAFNISENTFTTDDDQLPIGSKATGIFAFGTGEGIDNALISNISEGLPSGIHAKGMNTGFSDGLRFLCNEFGLSSSVIPLGIQVEEGAQVWPIQAGRGDLNTNQLLPAGNQFIGPGFTFIDQNVEFAQPPLITYYYFNGDSAQDPDTGLGNDNTIEPEPSDVPNSSCAPPCEICPPIVLDEFKEEFFEARGKREEKLFNLPSISEPEQVIAEEAAVKQLRHQMNKYAALIIRHYKQDTILAQPDSIIHWLNLTDSYPTDLELAKHYFFSGALTLFDTVWQGIPERHLLTPFQIEEYEHLSSLYKLLLEAQVEKEQSLWPGELAKLLQHYLGYCDESAFLSKALLEGSGTPAVVNCGLGINKRGAPTLKNPAYNQQIGTLQVFPNPATETFTLSWPEIYLSGNVCLYNAQGQILRQEVFDENVNDLTWGVNGLPKGLYLVEVCTESGQITRTKVLIQ